MTMTGNGMTQALSKYVERDYIMFIGSRLIYILGIRPVNLGLHC